MGSATKVTNISETARFAMKMYSKDLILIILQIEIRINMFPEVPKTVPRTSTVTRKHPTTRESPTN